MRWCLSLFAVLWVVPANAQSIRDGNGFLATCAKADDYVKVGCLSYVGGLHDMGGHLLSAGKVRAEICATGNVTLQQYYDVLVKYLQDYPERRNTSTAELFWAAASRAFPCRKPGG